MKPDSFEIAFDGRQIKVAVEQWGDEEREIVRHPGAVAIVAVDGEGFVTLVRQPREPARARLLELPAGTREPDEDSLATAKRELDEEAGLTGGSWRELATFYSTPGFCNERVTVYLAEGVDRGDPHPADNEDIELVRIPAGGISAHLDEIEDAKTLVGLLLFLRS